MVKTGPIVNITNLILKLKLKFKTRIPLEIERNQQKFWITSVKSTILWKFYNFSKFIPKRSRKRLQIKQNGREFRITRVIIWKSTILWKFYDSAIIGDLDIFRKFGILGKAQKQATLIKQNTRCKSSCFWI